jgi:hypothetical protein
MVHLTNQMVQKSPIPNIDQILKTNPDIARQLATAAMQSQSQPQRQPNMANSGGGNPLDGLANFMSSMVPPAPQQRPQTIKSPVKIARPQPQFQPQAQPQPPQQQMKPPSLPPDISELLKSVGVQEKKVVTTPKKPGSTGKNSVSIKL